jgi:hypothetical protein
MYLSYRYLVTVFHKHDHPLRERHETLNRLNTERCTKGFALVTECTFQPTKIYAQYDLAALVLIQYIDETMANAPASVDKSMYPSVASRELAIISSDYARKIFFIQMGQ